MTNENKQPTGTKNLSLDDVTKLVGDKVKSILNRSERRVGFNIRFLLLVLVVRFWRNLGGMARVKFCFVAVPLMLFDYVVAVFRLIPGTRAFRLRRNYLAVNSVRDHYSNIRLLGAAEGFDKASVRAMRSSVNKLYLIDATASACTQYFLLLLPPILLPWFVSAFAWIVHPVKANLWESVVSYFASAFAALLGFIFFFILPSAISRGSRKRKREFGYSADDIVPTIRFIAGFEVLMVLSGIPALLLFKYGGHEGMPGILAVTIASFLISGPFVWIAGIITVSLIKRLAERAKQATFESVVMKSVVDLITMLDKMPQHEWSHVESRNKLSERLELAARYLYIGFVRNVRSSDTGTSLWLRRTGLETAQAVRDLKKWLLTPKSDTRVALRKQLVEILKALASGSWDDLPRSEVDFKETKQHWIAQFGYFLKSLLVGCFITGSLFLVLKYAVPDQHSWRVYAILSGPLYFIVSIILHFDPDILAKIGLVKGYKSLVTNDHGEKDKA